MSETARLTAVLDDRYRIERELGSGGMATVYLALDLKHQREVALKVLRPELAAVLGAERFLQEIRVTARLDHPGPPGSLPPRFRRRRLLKPAGAALGSSGGSASDSLAPQ
jgi:serine/threonine protein kinase